MKVGVVFPQARIGRDPGALRALTEGIAELGFSHLLAYDHVLGVDPAMRPDWSGPYEASDPFHEPLTLFSFCAGVAPELGFATTVMILPQRQTALVAKQAAQLDMIAGGGLRLGVGTGWNEPEYESLGVPWSKRGHRLEEQVELLRRLWTEPAIEFGGRYHRLAGTGINPLPAAPIPVWFGGSSERALRRAAELGDGFFPQRPMTLRPLEDGWPARLEQIRAWRAAAGRDPDDLGVEPRLDLTEGDAAAWQAAAEQWISLGATRLAVSTIEIESGEAGVHLERLAAARAALADLFG